MDIQNVKISDIHMYQNNAKKHDKKQIANVAESIRQFGFVQPIVIDKNGVIIIGHCRYEAAKKLKMDEVPCVRAEDLTDEQVQKLRLLDNKLNESEWDKDLLLEDVSLLDWDGFDIDFGIDTLSPDDFGEDFTLPDGDKPEICYMSLTLHNKQKELIEYAISLVKNDITETFGNVNKNGNCIYEVVRQWAEQRK